MNAPATPRSSVLQQNLKEKGALYAAYISSFANGGIFIATDREFRLGAQRALDMCEQAGGPSEIAACILQDRSPSCGAGRIYDGTFSGTLTAGNGVFVDLLLRHGYRVIPASEFDPSMLEHCP